MDVCQFPATGILPWISLCVYDGEIVHFRSPAGPRCPEGTSTSRFSVAQFFFNNPPCPACSNSVDAHFFRRVPPAAAEATAAESCANRPLSPGLGPEKTHLPRFAEADSHPDDVVIILHRYSAAGVGRGATAANPPRTPPPTLRFVS